MQNLQLPLLPTGPSPGRASILLAVIVPMLFCGCVSGLYEDQIGKFDWKRTHIGEIRYAAFQGASGERIIAATAHNVLAALHTKTGDIAWRKLFENNERGAIQFLHVTRSASLAPPPESSRERAQQLSAAADEDADLVVTVSGTAPAMVRGWHALTGHAQFEWSLTPNAAEPQAQRWLFTAPHGGQLHHIVLVWGSHLESTSYAVRTGQPIRSSTRRVAAEWTREQDCVLTERLIACLVGDNAELVTVELTTENMELRRYRLARAGTKLQHLPGIWDAVRVDGEVYVLGGNKVALQVATVTPGASAIADGAGAEALLVQAKVRGTTLHLNSSSLQTGEHSADIDAQLDHSKHAADARLVDVLCKRKTGQAPICRLLVTTSDAGVLLVQQGRAKWTRDEALADVVAVQMIDLQLSDAEGSIETELKNKNGDIFGALARRLTGQVAHLRNTLLATLGLDDAAAATKRAGLVRDAFGLHKMLVVLTGPGKLFGIDNLSGNVHWVHVLPDFRGFSAQEPMRLLVQRSAGHFPLGAQCTVLASDRRSGTGALYQFDPLTGQPISGDGIVRLPYAVRQAALVAHVRPNDFVRALLLLDTENRAHVVPADAVGQADGFFLFAANAETGCIYGVQVRASADGRALTTQPIWEVDLSGGKGATAHRIVRAVTKDRAERVHSQGRVFNDRSVLYKYVNPNLVVVATLGPDPVHKSILNIHLLDVVSGSIVYSMSHRRVREPLHIVHSENWLVYTYFNEKVRRTECTTVELYEGKTQSNSTVWSSLHAPQLPLVERQSYILPGHVVAMHETITERGITNKHVLVGLATGSVVEMPWAWLDPRRPVPQPNAVREEGIIPYMPELMLPSEHVINYNQSVAKMRGIAAAPSGLESTCLVMAYGLDIFVTRVAPSKTFDLLKEDFDYMLIMIVLVGLITASVVVKQLSARKAVKQAWK